MFSLKIAQTIVGCGVLHLGKIIYLIWSESWNNYNFYGLQNRKIEYKI